MNADDLRHAKAKIAAVSDFLNLQIADITAAHNQDIERCREELEEASTNVKNLKNLEDSALKVLEAFREQMVDAAMQMQRDMKTMFTALTGIETSRITDLNNRLAKMQNSSANAPAIDAPKEASEET